MPHEDSSGEDLHYRLLATYDGSYDEFYQQYNTMLEGFKIDRHIDLEKKTIIMMSYKGNISELEERIDSCERAGMKIERDMEFRTAGV